MTTAALPYLRASAAAGGPGAIVTITSHAGVRPKGASVVRQHWRTNAPKRRAAQPEDVADLAGSLIANRYLTER